MNGFGGPLRLFRLRAGLSQTALADLANLSPAAVTGLERGAHCTRWRRRWSCPRRAGLLAAATGVARRRSTRPNARPHVAQPSN
ncbi:MAG: helix-turn-helix transcriptional regulator [Chloroflexi bacterium]|nr:helix-turn-helix transcriptional regulator [Chloroflexota bacterium]